MPINFGEVLLSRELTIPFTTAAIDGTRLGFSDDLATSDIRIYKENGTTEGAIQNGRTVSSNFDSLVGVHTYTVDLADSSQLGFFEVGSSYWVVLYPAVETVEGRLLSKVLATFNIVSALHPVPIRGIAKEKPSRQVLEEKLDAITVELSTIKNTLRQKREDEDGRNSIQETDNSR